MRAPMRSFIPLTVGGALLLALLVAPAGGAASEPCAGTTTLSGTLAGEDHRFVKALLGFELRDASGQSVGPDGCPVSGIGYQRTHTVNPHLDALGTNNPDGNTKQWSVAVPTNAVHINIEVYPKSAGLHGPTDHTRYGNARIQGTQPAASPVSIVLPLNCGLSDNGVTGTNGSITVAITRDGQVVAPDRASAFSIAPTAFPRGFGIARQVPEGEVSEILALAGDQRYRMFLRLTPTSTVRTIDLDVQGCSATVWTMVLDKFQDVPWGHAFFDEIYWMWDQGLSQGWPDDTYRPSATVTRQAMAAFLWRRAGEPAAPTDAPIFPDVPPTHPFHAAISWLAAEGITGGFGDGTFRPGADISRQAVAAFLWRFAGEPTPLDTEAFADVTAANLFHEAIQWKTGAGITTGFPDGTFRPTASVTRQAMAAFVFRFESP